MSQYEPIHNVAARLGLTSRTLRHWEDEGLFASVRDRQSGWRLYDDQTMGKIRFTLIMRELDIPVKDIREVLESGNPRTAALALHHRMERLGEEGESLRRRKRLLQACLTALAALPELQETRRLALMESTLASQIHSTQSIKNDWEESVMTSNKASSGMFRIITLPPMRLAACNVVSASPEDEALGRVTGWAEAQGLMGTARIFGYNTTPYTPGQAEYGWAAAVTVPDSIELPDFLEEKRLPGGLYAMLASTNEIYDSWQALVKEINESAEVEADHGRPCLEEHIRNGNPAGCGNEYYLNLLEPVKRK